MESFALTIELGNEAMQTRLEVATSLRDVADRLLQTSAETGAIKDLNGNTVGDWGFQ